MACATDGTANEQGGGDCAGQQDSPHGLALMKGGERPTLPAMVSYRIASGGQDRRQPSVVMVNEIIHSRWR
jgi:hypothetical protein